MEDRKISILVWFMLGIFFDLFGLLIFSFSMGGSLFGLILFFFPIYPFYRAFRKVKIKYLKNKVVAGVLAVVITVAFLLLSLYFISSPIPPDHPFETACLDWSESNCAGDVPQEVCRAYNNLYDRPEGKDCNENYETIAAMCGCTKPYGTEK